MHLSDFQKRLGLTFALLAAYFALRLPHLRDLPVFCDESVYVHFAQMIHDHPLHNLFISLELGKFPLHYWLMALTLPLSNDPITAGRLFSVFCGALLIPLFFLLARELQHWSAARAPQCLPALRFFAPLAAAFTITNPLLASYQRMALAEPLLLLESTTLVLLSLRLARQLAQSAAINAPQDQAALNAPPIQNQKSKIKNLLKNPRFTATALGLVWAATLLTKQNFSYLLWIFPPLALTLYATRHSYKQPIKTFLKPYALATSLGLLFFIPILFSSNTQSLAARLFYQQLLVRPNLPWTQIVSSNFISLLLPRINGHLALWPHNPNTPLQDGMLYLYFSPLIFLLLLAALFQLRRTGINRLTLLFFSWSTLLLGPLLLSSNLLKARYALAGIFPLLLLAAWTAADLINSVALTLQSKIKNRAPSRFPLALAPALVLLALLAWPLSATVAQTLSFNAPTRTLSERDEYLADLSGGQAWEDTLAWLTTQSQSHPLTLITGPGFSLNNDFLWLSLRNNPNIHLYCTNILPLQGVRYQPDTYLLSPDQWRPQLARPVTLPRENVYTIGFALFDPDTGRLAAVQPPASFLPDAQLVRLFQNTPLLPAQKPLTGISLIARNPSTPTPQLSSPLNP